MRTPLRAVAPLCLLLAGCLGGSGGASHPGYLDQAVNEGRVFRWTPTEGETVDLYVEVHDGAGELPGAIAGRFGAADIAEWVDDALKVWLTASGTPYALHLRSHAAGEKHPASRTVIHLQFVEGAGSALVGTVEMSTGSDPRRVDSARVELGVPQNGASIPASAYRRLVRHEFGHLLGIIAFQPGPGTGHSPDQGDLMYPVITGDELSPADRATIAALYGLEPDLLRADGPGGDAGVATGLWVPGLSPLPAVAAPPLPAASGERTVVLRARCEG